MNRFAIVSYVLVTACSGDLVGDPTWGDDVSVGSTSSATHTGPEIVCDNVDSPDKAEEIQGHLNAGDRVVLSSGICVVIGPLYVSRDNTTIEGAGPDATQIKFVPTGQDQALFRLEDTNELENVTLKNLGINSGITDPRLDQTKTAIYVHDARNLTIDNVSIEPWDAATASKRTTGVEVRGRELGTYRRLWVHADVPLKIAANIDEQTPGAYRDAQKDLGHHHFQDLYLASNQPPDPVVVIEPGVVVRHVTFDGTQAWVNGGLTWVDGGTVARRHSSHIRIANVRVEGVCDGLMPACGTLPVDSRPWAIDIQKNRAAGTQDPGFPAHLDDLLIEFSLTAGRGIFSSAGGAWNGVRLGGVARTVLYQVRHEDSTGEALRTDGYGVVLQGPP